MSAAWTFHSAREAQPTRVPVLSVRFTPRLDDSAHAPAGWFVMSVSVQTPVGVVAARPRLESLDVSLDDGVSWQESGCFARAPKRGSRCFGSQPVAG